MMLLLKYGLEGCVCTGLRGREVGPIKESDDELDERV